MQINTPRYTYCTSTKFISCCCSNDFAFGGLTCIAGAYIETRCNIRTTQTATSFVDRKQICVNTASHIVKKKVAFVYICEDTMPIMFKERSATTRTNYRCLLQERSHVGSAWAIKTLAVVLYSFHTTYPHQCSSRFRHSSFRWFGATDEEGDLGCPTADSVCPRVVVNTTYYTHNNIHIHVISFHACKLFCYHCQSIMSRWADHESKDEIQTLNAPNLLSFLSVCLKDYTMKRLWNPRQFARIIYHDTNVRSCAVTYLW